jgi:hypothetical protein
MPGLYFAERNSFFIPKSSNRILYFQESALLDLHGEKSIPATTFIFTIAQIIHTDPGYSANALGSFIITMCKPVWSRAFEQLKD